MDQKNDTYCANDVSKQDFIKNSQKFIEIKLKLREIRDRYTADRYILWLRFRIQFLVSENVEVYDSSFSCKRVYENYCQ
jgi:hypothetical protein